MNDTFVLNPQSNTFRRIDEDNRLCAEGIVGQFLTVIDGHIVCSIVERRFYGANDQIMKASAITWCGLTLEPDDNAAMFDMLNGTHVDAEHTKRCPVCEVAASVSMYPPEAER